MSGPGHLRHEAGEQAHALVLRVGHEEMRLRRHYETLSILNDIASALMFVVGSVLFFSETTTYVGTWLFLIGSVLLVFRPGIRLARRFHLGRLKGGSGSHESSMDF